MQLFPFPTGHNPEEAKPSGFSESAREEQNEGRAAALGDPGYLKPVKLWAARRCVCTSPAGLLFVGRGSERGPEGEVEEMKNTFKSNRSDFFLCIYKDQFFKVIFV